MTPYLICGLLHGGIRPFPVSQVHYIPRPYDFAMSSQVFSAFQKNFCHSPAEQKIFVIARTRAFLINRCQIPPGNPTAFGQTTRYSIYSLGSIIIYYFSGIASASARTAPPPARDAIELLCISVTQQVYKLGICRAVYRMVRGREMGRSKGSLV